MNEWWLNHAGPAPERTPEEAKQWLANMERLLKKMNSENVDSDMRLEAELYGGPRDGERLALPDFSQEIIFPTLHACGCHGRMIYASNSPRHFDITRRAWRYNYAGECIEHAHEAS